MRDRIEYDRAFTAYHDALAHLRNVQEHYRDNEDAGEEDLLEARKRFNAAHAALIEIEGGMR